MGRSALLLGASGLVGGYCLEQLLQSDAYDKVMAVVRKKLDIPQHKKLEQRVIDFDRLEDYRSILRADDIYCCLGTTVLQSPKREEYYKVDFTYPYEIAKIVKANGAEQFSVISALSASEHSVFFYGRVKGKLERALSRLHFKSLNIFRPSMLVGKREKSRLIEKIGIISVNLLSPFLIGKLRKYRSIEAKAVAHAMVAFSVQHKPGVHIILSDTIQNIYDKL